MSLKVVVARCPRCSATLAAEPGRAWLVCGACPTARDGLSGQAVTTYRPAGDPGDPRLPFWLFADGPRRDWVAAYRCAQAPGRRDLDVMLTEAGHAPELEPAPLGALLARGLAQARDALIRRGQPPAVSPRLVSLAVRLEDGHLVEPVTGFRVLARLIRPLGWPGPDGASGGR